MPRKADPLARRMARLFAQPRIPGIRRQAVYTALLPDVLERLRSRAVARKQSLSRILAEHQSAALGVNAATGKKVERRK